MSVTSLGPALSIDAPLPVAPPHGLLKTPGVLVEGGRWSTGVSVWGYPCDPPSTWEPCSSGSDRIKDTETDVPIERFDSFVVYQPIVCSGISMGTDPEGFAGRAMTLLEATASYGVEQAISQGVTGSSNPYFQDGGVTTLGGGAVTAQAGLSYLENAIGATGRQGMIHAPPAVIAAWQTFFVSGRDEDVLLTANGTPVVSGGGYIGAGSPAAGSAYAYATGPVRVYLGERFLSPPQISEALDRSVNDVVFFAEQSVLPYWDTCLQVRVLIDFTP